MSALRTRMRADLTTAMRGRDRVTVGALRSALGALDNAGAVPLGTDPLGSGPTVPGPASEHVAAAVGPGAAEVDRRELSDADERAVLRAEIDERTAAAARYRAAGRSDAAGRPAAEAEVLARYL